MMYLLTSGGLALLILRLVVGVIFLAHAWPKIKDLKANASNFEMMGFKPGKFWGTIVACVEFFGSLCLLLGFAVQVAGLLLAINMVVAATWRIRSGHRLVGGYELDLLLLSGALVLATLGTGAYTLNSVFPIVLF